ncbi:hypothetical protein [Natrialba sp. INN-245]|uniref:hypothetical protein n=1 Tax=Natrialba sp. INN-245 TaxID=2690967 RepID=UPI00131052F4|nr:hypothetical protein [Natrialba sp. INN-245]MWV41116.1 hypothetical protein [Natrialba sp. INN-245]
MTDDNRISRRASLKGIAATGTFIGGSVLGVSSVSAGDDSSGVKRVDFTKCHSMAVHFRRSATKSAKKGVVATATVRLYNANPSANENYIENYQKKITKGDLRTHPKKKGEGKHVWKFNVFQFYDRTPEDGDKILSVKIDGKQFENPNKCAKSVSNARTKKSKKGKINPRRINLISVCTDAKTDMARYKVTNSNAKPVKVTYEGKDDGKDVSGTVKVEAKSTTYFDVRAPDGKMAIVLYHDGKQVSDKVQSATDQDCILRPRAFNAECVNRYRTKAKYYLHSNIDSDRTFVYRVDETGEKGTITLEHNPANAKFFWVKAPKGKATVTLYYEGVPVGTASSADVDVCDPVVNRTQGESYDSIQDAIDDADENDRIRVFGKRFEENVTVDVDGLTLTGDSKKKKKADKKWKRDNKTKWKDDKSRKDGKKARKKDDKKQDGKGKTKAGKTAKKPVIDGGVSIEADGVTLRGFRIENDDGRGIDLDPGISDVKILCNKITASEQAIADSLPGGISDLKIANNVLHTSGSGSQVVYIHGEASGGTDAENVNLVSNVIKADDLDGGLAVGLEVDGGTVAKNTFADPPTDFGHLELWGPDVTVKSNKFRGHNLGEDAFYVVDQDNTYHLNAIRKHNRFDPRAKVDDNEIIPK